jgi:hypothetical protein
MTFSTSHIQFINKFLERFRHLFTPAQFRMLKLFLLASFKNYKRFSLQALANELHISYQRLQYFFSDSAWPDIDSINTVRLNILNHQISTRSSPNGILAIDDSAVPKPYAKNTEGAQFQYCAPLKKEANCNVAVASAFVSESKHFPVDFRPYIPEDQCQHPDDFKSKIQLAKDLIIQADDQKIAFKHILFDAWYTCSSLLEFIAARNLKFIAEIKSNRSIRFTHPKTKTWTFLQAADLIPVLKEFYAHKFKSFRIQSKNYSKNVFYYCFQSKLKDCSVPVQVIFIFDKWSANDDKPYHILITNQLNLSPEDIFRMYSLRWGIEESFRELKDSFCFDQFQVRHQEQISRHWIMSFLAWSLAYWVKQNGYLSKTLVSSPDSINQTKEAIASLILIDSACLLSKNNNLHNLDFFKSKEFIKKLKS